MRDNSGAGEYGFSKAWFVFKPKDKVDFERLNNSLLLGMGLN